MKSPEKQLVSVSATAVKSDVRINKKLAIVLYMLLAIVSISLLIMTVCASALGENADYPMVNALIFSLLSGSVAVSIVTFNPQKSIYDLGFYLLHIGIVIFIAGMMIFACKGSAYYVTVPDLSSVTEDVENQMKNIYGWSSKDIERLNSYRNQIGADGGEIIDLGFNFRIIDFETQYYEDGESIRHYEATLEFFLSEGTTETIPLTVNHPIYRCGWKIYLMNVNTSLYGYEQINLLIKNDPAEFISVAGIILIVLGTFMMCILPKKSLKLCSEHKKRGVISNG